ncbi:type II CAAX endopeptidase family protein [Pseudoxanthomonas sp. JBR18]|uniref:CPBP family intramembrane glutamic endopeptidase n=1 Tax=Pseudoxanthomonas sp. JBR18 TaxID=2969308 RepID=UPI002305A755|nr:type II CAAX endopeptidase family protein [Pseudoxanthomonas sp. JBR18]WCE05750.1 type II CAAX endopeptidase family protein [Pseudoxanthomonas sp. JBR18]
MVPTPLDPPPLPLGRALRRFALDVLIVSVLFALLSLLGGVGWGVWRGVMIALHGEASGQDAHAIMAAVGQPGPLATMLLSIVGVGGTALIALLWRAPPRASERQVARQAMRLPATWLLALMAGSVAILCSIVVGQVAASMQEQLDPSNMSLVRGTLGRYPALLVLFAVILAPIYEEVLFRRVLFRRLWQDGWPILGMAASGLLFAFMHEPPLLGGKSLAAALPLWAVYTAMGIVFAWVYRRTGSLAASILAHGLNNAFAIGMMLAFGIST